MSHIFSVTTQKENERHDVIGNCKFPVDLNAKRISTYTQCGKRISTQCGKRMEGNTQCGKSLEDKNSSLMEDNKALKIANAESETKISTMNQTIGSLWELLNQNSNIVYVVPVMHVLSYRYPPPPPPPMKYVRNLGINDRNHDHGNESCASGCEGSGGDEEEQDQTNEVGQCIDIISLNPNAPSFHPNAPYRVLCSGSQNGSTSNDIQPMNDVPNFDTEREQMQRIKRHILNDDAWFKPKNMKHVQHYGASKPNGALWYSLEMTTFYYRFYHWISYLNYKQSTQFSKDDCEFYLWIYKEYPKVFRLIIRYLPSHDLYALLHVLGLDAPINDFQLIPIHVKSQAKVDVHYMMIMPITRLDTLYSSDRLDIGISFICDPRDGKPKVSGIHLNPENIRQSALTDDLPQNILSNMKIQYLNIYAHENEYYKERLSTLKSFLRRFLTESDLTLKDWNDDGQALWKSVIGELPHKPYN
eukprot:1092870_1